jgi:D-beta-D-heptose 7-phosphate kinase/D-beta-D-heptose 1-phosphate adenosyltransferase
MIDNFSPELFKTAKILCIGDVMLDRYLYGSVERISPEAPVPIVRVHQETEMLGGSGNVVRNVSALHGTVHFITTVAQDFAGEKVQKLLSQLPGVTYDLHTLRVGETIVKTRVIAEKQQVLRTDRENPKFISDYDRDQIYVLATQAIKTANALILSDYGKGVLTPDLNQRLIALAHSHSIPIFIDPKSADFADYAGATFITPNLKEFQAATGSTATTDSEIAAQAYPLMANHNIQNLLVTRSQEGMSLIQGDKNLATHIPTRAQEVFDVSGAGDTVIATFAMAIGAGIAAAQAAEIANTAAGVVIGKLGTATLTPDELVQGLHHDPCLTAHTVSHPKAHSWPDALETVLRWRKQGYKIGFTNGCFDLLHPGHTKLLNEAKQACDRLIVGLNADVSVRALKGPTRPLNAEQARAELLLNLRAVDMVVIFTQATPKELICHLKPDVLIKGADYTLEQVVGAQEILAWGGTVHLVDLVPGQSTTNIIERSLQYKNSGSA